MRRLFTVGLVLLLPLTLGVAGANAAPWSVATQEPAEEEHPQGEEEHPQGEAAEEEEHPKGEAEGEEHPEGEGEEHPEGEAAAGEEHPEGEGEAEEHPEGEAAEGEEHPEGEGEEHPQEGGSTEVAVEHLTVDQLAEAITEWVAAEAAAKGGFLEIEHPDTGETLELKLDKVHRERLSRVGEQTYFACADFVGRDGTLYDLDIFVRGPNREALETTEVTLHKVSGEARYTWYEEDGVWKTRPAA